MRDARLMTGILCLILFSAPVYAWAQVSSTAGLADPLDNLEGSARDLGMGSAFAGVADDSSALFFNSAGLSSIARPEVALHHNSYLAGTFQETLVAAFPTGGNSALAFALNYVNWGALDLRDNYGTSQGSFNDSDVGFMAGFGARLAPGFSAGVALRGTQQKVVNDLYNSLAGDAGLLFSPAEGFQLGISYLNLGTPLQGDGLAQELRFGASLLTSVSPRLTLLTALAGSWVPSGPSEAQGGIEAVLDHQWSLRAGGQIPFYDNQVSGFADFTAGAGVKFSNFALDYAYLPFGSLGTSHRVSLSYQFDLPKQTIQVPVTIIQTVPAAAASAPSHDVDVEFKIQTQPQDPLAEGQALEKEGKDALAAQSYAKALQADPKNERLWSALGHLYYRLGKKDYAVECFEKVLDLDPNDQALRQWLEQYKAR